MESLKRNQGQGLIEYILIVALMGVLAIAAINALSDETQTGFEKATQRLGREFGRI